MNGTAYKVLGYGVWRAAKWYLRRTYGRLIPSRRVALGGAALLAVAGVVALGASQRGSE